MKKLRMWNPSVAKYTYFSRPELVAGVSYGPKSEPMSGIIFHADGPMYISPYNEPEWCTGLTVDKSYRGTEPEDLLVFEGDIFWDGDYEKKFVVRYESNEAAWMADYDDGNTEYLGDMLTKTTEIIGNHWDNPELLEVDGE